MLTTKRYEDLIKAEAKIEVLERLLGISDFVPTKEIKAVLEIESKEGKGDAEL